MNSCNVEEILQMGNVYGLHCTSTLGRYNLTRTATFLKSLVSTIILFRNVLVPGLAVILVVANDTKCFDRWNGGMIGLWNQDEIICGTAG